MSRSYFIYTDLAGRGEESPRETCSPPEAEAATVHVSDDLISKRDIETASIDIRGQVEESGEVSNKR